MMNQQGLDIIQKVVNETSFMKDGYYITISKEDNRFFVLKYVFGTKRTPDGKILHEDKNLMKILIKDARDGFDNYENVGELANSVIKNLISKGFPKKTLYIDMTIINHFKECSG